MSLLDYRKRKQGHVLDVSEAIPIYIQILQAINYCHNKGIRHNDIKSGNVLVDVKDGKITAVYLSDFEYAERVYRPSKRRGGTKFFRAPEVPNYL